MLLWLGCGMSSLLFSATAVHTSRSSLLQTRERASSLFDQYRIQFGRKYAEGSEEHGVRQRLFGERVAKIDAHNSRSKGHPWRAGINHLTDRTEKEFLQLRGFRRHRKSESDDLQVSLLEEKTCSSRSQLCSTAQCCKGLVCAASGSCEPEPDALPASIDWSTRLSSGSHILDQGSCGSCWAIAAQGAIELQVALLTNKSLALSAQGMLGCTANPDECGGTGGCEGATPDLAFKWAKENGVHLLSSQAYTASSHCPKSFLKAQPEVRIQGFVHLKDNSARKAMAALVTAGPLTVGVEASGWMSYVSGIFDSCGVDATVDHAVLMVGYGSDSRLPYWKIRNSWGQGFGEEGFIRLRRHAPDAEEPCGWDYDPQKGVGCKGGPSKLRVCGTCGVLSDLTYPVGTTVGNV